MNISLWQGIAIAAITAITSVIGAVLVYRQQLKTADKAAASKDRETAANIETAKLESNSLLHNLWHSDFVESQKRCDQLNDQLNEANRERYKVEAEAAMCHGRLEDLKAELAEKESDFELLEAQHHALDMEKRNIETKLVAVRFMMSDVRLMRAALSMLEEGLTDQVMSDNWLHQLEARALKEQREKQFDG